MRKVSFIMRIGSMLVAFALVPTILLMAVMIHFNNDNIREQALARANQECGRMLDELESVVQGVENMAATLGMDQTLIKYSKVLRRGASIGQEVDAYIDLCQMIALAKGYGSMDDLRLYLPDGQLVTRQRRNIFGLSDLSDGKLPSSMNSYLLNSGWAREDKQLAFYYRVVYTPMNYPVLALLVDMDRLDRMLDGFEIHGGAVISVGEEEMYRWGGEQDGVTARGATSGGLSLEVRVPASQFEVNRKPAYVMGLGGVVVLLVAIPILAWTVSRPVNRTVGALAEANEAMTRQEYRRLPEDSRLTELYTLQISHNRMIDSIQTMIRDVYEARHEQDQAELDVLFEQVKPHFLYNTLEGGKWLALQEKAPRTAQFMERLAAFYRIGLSKGDNFVPLSKEIDHIERYVELMNLRYSDRIELTCDLQDYTREAMVLRLTLQPLVENSIEHGLHGQGGEGRIRVAARREEATLLISVEDNGTGMDEEAIDRFNREGEGGYGLSNVRKRLEIYYGGEASLGLANRPEGGLTVMIRVPYQQQ